MAVTLTVSDNADGTGGVATISGTAGGTTTIYRSSFNGLMKAYSWTSVGTVAGNGTLAVATVGYWVWLAVNVNSGVTTFSSLYYQNLSNATDSVHYNIMEAVKNRIQSIGLTGIKDNRYFVRWIPRPLQNVDGKPPYVYICPIGVEQDASVLMAQDDIGYPVGVFLVDGADQNNILNLERDLQWREQVAKSLRNQRLEGVTATLFNCKIEYGGIVDVSAFMKNYLVSALIFRFFVREQRGLGV